MARLAYTSSCLLSLGLWALSASAAPNGAHDWSSSTRHWASSSSSAPVSSTSAPSTATAPPTAVLQSCAASLNGHPPAVTPPGYDWNGVVRRFYVAAEEVEWDYTPTGWDNWLGVPIGLSPRANRINLNKWGSKWQKALYRGYTDDTFSTYSEQPAWQGTQGPTIRAEVGDLIEIMFVNKLDRYYATMHSMGLSYTKYDGEGADYPNNTAPGENVVIGTNNAVPPMNGGVQPGDCTVYKWMVGTADGPLQGGFPAQVHSYHSYITMQSDEDAGLIGPTIIYRAGEMNSTMANYREFTLLYMEYNEANSWLSGTNQAKLDSGNSSANNGEGRFSITDAQINDLWSGNKTVWQPQLINLQGSGNFENAPDFHTMNGYLFANNPTFEMCLNDKVIWYVNAMGSASHVFHMHGNGFTYPYNGVNTYATSINAGIGKTLYMNATDRGKWQVICHVNNHHDDGMVSDYMVYDPDKCPLPALAS